MRNESKDDTNAVKITSDQFPPYKYKAELWNL